jgi:hypothetical protein
MSHSKTLTKTKIARAKGVAKRSAKPERIPSASTGSGTKQEAVSYDRMLVTSEVRRQFELFLL